MNSDAYMKFILTVIAVCLVVIVLQNANFIPNAQANENESFNEAILEKSHVRLPLNEDGTLNVRVKSMDDKLMNVNIEQVGGAFIKKGIPTTVNNKVDVNLTELGGYFVYDRLPVENR